MQLAAGLQDYEGKSAMSVSNRAESCREGNHAQSQASLARTVQQN